MRQKKSLGIDLKVYTREEIEFMMEEDNPFIAQVFKEGKVLWSLDDNQKACCPS